MLVARLRLRGMSQREIQHRLSLPGEDGRLVAFNPATGKPWSLGTINFDCKALDKQWQEAAAEAIADRKARLLAESDEVKREAWRAGDLRTVLAAMKQEREMLGLDQPLQVKQDAELVVRFEGNVKPEEL
jgi:hypothetical protein